MNLKRLLLPGAALALLLMLGPTGHGPQAAQDKAAAEATKWEYKIVYFRWGRAEKGARTESMERVEEVMNDLGGKGWELSGTINDVAGDTDKTLRVTMNTNLVLLFKRPKR